VWRNWKRIRLQSGRLQVRALSPLLDQTLTRPVLNNFIVEGPTGTGPATRPRGMGRIEEPG
jgi:hypothetical protein